MAIVQDQIKHLRNAALSGALGNALISILGVLSPSFHLDYTVVGKIVLALISLKGGDYIHILIVWK